MSGYCTRLPESPGPDLLIWGKGLVGQLLSLLTAASNTTDTAPLLRAGPWMVPSSEQPEWVRHEKKSKEPPGSLNSRCLGALFLEEVVYCPLTGSHGDECHGKVTGISARPHDMLTQSKFSAESRENCPCREAQCDPWVGHSICTSWGSLSRRWESRRAKFSLYHQDSAPGPSPEQSIGKWSVGADQQNMANQSDPSGSGNWTQQLTSPVSPTLSRRRDKTSTA